MTTGDSGKPRGAEPPEASPAPVAEILATAVVPWTGKREFDETAFRRQVQTIASGLTRHIYIFGTAGEGYAVTDREFERIATAFWEASLESAVKPMLGAISLSLGTIIERIELGRRLGFRTFQLSLPSWGALNDRELDVFFEETCGRFPDCRFHHYNLLRSRRLLTSVEYRRLAAAHPNLVAVKASTSDPAVVADLLSVSPRLRFFFTELGYAIARRTHEVGLLISIAAISFRRAREFVEGDDARRAADAVDMEKIIVSLKEIAGGRYHMDGAFDKLFARFLDPDFPLVLLPPYAGATIQDFESFRSRLPAGWLY